MLWLIHRQLKSKDAAARRKAAEQLCQDPKPGALAILRGALGDSDVDVRRLAVTALGKIEDDGCIEPLLGALRDRAPEVQKAAILGLKRLADERIAPLLAQLLRDSDAGVRAAAAQSVEARGWRPSTRDEEIWLLVARGQCSRAAAFGVAALPALELVLQSGPFSLCVAAVQALAEINDPRVLRLLLAAARSAEITVCVAAVDALAKMGDSQAVETIITLLSNRNGQVRLTAVEALGTLGAAKAAGPLRGLLRDPLWDVRRAVAETLGRLKDTEAVEALTQSLGDGDADVREATAMALGNLSDRQAIGPLIMALKDGTSGVRRIAAAALSRIDPEWSLSDEARVAVNQLKSSLAEADPGARHFIEQLLVGLGAVAPKAAVLETEDTAASSPMKRRKLAVSLFLAILCDFDRDLRQSAAEALGRLGDDRARPGLVRAGGDADAFVRAAAEQALQAIGGEAASG
jgi:HEAT repeat protein